MRRTLLVVAVMLVACSRNAKLSDDTATPNESKSSKDWQGQQVSQAEELLAGRFPGVQVLRVTGGIAVRIRGESTITGDKEPLYVVDGMTIEAGPGGALTGINPSDIEKIEVLKDIGSTAQYGVRGANGVILITTKRAK